MTSAASPSETRALIIERLVGDSGEAAQVIGVGRGMAERALPLLQKALAVELGAPVTIDLQAVEVSRVPEARSRAGDAFALTIVSSPASADAMTLVMDAHAVAVMVSALFGGDPDQPVAPIERDLATSVFQEVLVAPNRFGASLAVSTWP